MAKGVRGSGQINERAFQDPGAWLRSQAHAAEVEEASRTQDGLTAGDLSQARSICDATFVEEPVDLDTFIRDKKFIGMGPLSEPQYNVLKVAERIYLADLYPHMAVEFGDYWKQDGNVKNLLTLLVGKGGGKDMLSRLASLRIAYLVLCLNDPKGYFGMPQDESIHLLNVAATKDQARLAFFEPMTRITARGWWKDRCHPLKKVIEWEKGLTTLSGSSDADTQEGLNLLLGVADEVDAFRTEAEVVKTAGAGARSPQRSAEGILKMIRSSAITRFPQTFKNLRISYPRYFGSPILTLHAQAMRDIAVRGKESRHFVVGPLPSWEFNPLLKRSRFVSHPSAYVKSATGVAEPVNIPVEWSEDFDSDPSWARAAYLCDPERTRLPPYFRSENAVDAVMEVAPEIEVRWEYVRGAWQCVYSIPRALQPAPGATYACHADLAVTADRAGIAMAHVVSWDAYETRDNLTGDLVRWEELPVVKVDALVGLEADRESDPPREIQLRAVRQLVFELRQRGFPIAQVTLDGFQSRETRQEIEVAGIEAPLYSVDRTEDPYKTFRMMVEEGRAQLPYSPLLRTELLGLSQDQRTRRVDHEPGGSKDLADAACGAVNGAIEVGGREFDEGEQPESHFWTSAPVAAPLGADGAWSDMIMRRT